MLQLQHCWQCRICWFTVCGDHVIAVDRSWPKVKPGRTPKSLITTAHAVALEQRIAELIKQQSNAQRGDERGYQRVESCPLALAAGSKAELNGDTPGLGGLGGRAGACDATSFSSTCFSRRMPKPAKAEKYENVELSGQRDSAKTAKFSLLAA